MSSRKKKGRRGPNVSAVKKGAKEQSRRGGGGGWYYDRPDNVEEFEFTTDTARIDIIPFEVTDKTHDAVREGRCAVGDLWYKRTIWIHRSVGAEGRGYCCPTTIGNKCPVCEEHKRLQNDKDADESVVKALKRKQRELFFVRDLGTKGDEIQISLLDMSFHTFGRLLAKEINESDDDNVANFANIEDGLTLKVRTSEESIGDSTFIEADRIDFIEREDQYEEEVLDLVCDPSDIIKVPTYKELEAAFYESSSSEEEEEDESEEEDEEPFVKDDPEEDEEEDPDDEVAWKQGDRVVVDIEGEDYAGEITKVKEDTAMVTFDDGDDDEIDLDELRAEDAEEDDEPEEDPDEEEWEDEEDDEPEVETKKKKTRKRRT